MAEYINVEKPFLDKLKELNWKVIDHGASGIPKDPNTSLRTNFNEVILTDELKHALKKINVTDTGQSWLTDKQVDDVVEELLDNDQLDLKEANKRIHELFLKNTSVSKNELTGEQDPTVRFFDFNNWRNNSFIAINQFRVDTPHSVRKAIIPDIVLFVNGLPLVVIECKDEDVSEPLSEAFDQVRRYSNTREDEFGVKEGEEKLFHCNLFSIITHGREARFGSITAEFDYYYNWKDIFPEEYKVIDVTKDRKVKDGDDILGNSRTQEVMIHGMLNKEILLDVLKHFTIFMEIKEGVEVKIVPRYQQYRAVGKILTRLRDGNDHNERSGVIWHTQGSGKSLTMVFLIRKLRSQEDLKDHKIILVVDRKDLEKQLTDTARLSDETVNIISKRKKLRERLSTDSSDLNMVMIHKMMEEEIRHSKALKKALSKTDTPPKFKPFEKVNDSDRILILIDEAHRTQGGEMGDNLFTGFPNATRIAFTGTPLLTNRHKQKTHDRFGGFIDQYKIKEAVKDRATLNIIYIGRTSKDTILDPEKFQKDFDDEFKERTKEEIEAIKKKYGNMEAYLSNKERIKKIVKDIVTHYIDEILPNGFKAQIVASSIRAAVYYKNYIDQEIQVRIKEEQQKLEVDEELVKKLQFLKSAAVVSSQGNNEKGFITKARNEAKEWKAVENFKKDFNYKKELTGIAFLCVCDRLLTGFDAPVEQVMYLDKNMREHDLLQAIARVNRTKGEKKKHGMVVDYFGVANNLKEALGIYGGGDEEALEEFLETFRDINKEVPVLEARYNRMLQLFSDYKIADVEDYVNQRIASEEREREITEEIIEMAANVKFRAEFDTYLKTFFDSMDLLANIPSVKKKYWIPTKRFGYLLMRIRNHYRDPSMDIKWAGEKVRKLIDKHLVSFGIDSSVPPVDLLSDDFPKEIDKHKLSPKTKASDMEHAIRRHIKINMNKDPGYYTKMKDKMQSILDTYKGRWEHIVEEFSKLREEMAQGRDAQEDVMDSYQMPFYDLILLYAFEGKEVDKDTSKQIQELVSVIVDELQKRIHIINFWKKPTDIQELEGAISDEIEFCGIDEISDKFEKITTEVIALAKKRHDNLIRNK